MVSGLLFWLTLGFLWAFLIFCSGLAEADPGLGNGHVHVEAYVVHSRERCWL